MSYYPPGVTDGMIPGNRPEDRWWEQVLSGLDNEVEEAYHTDQWIESKIDSFSERYTIEDDPDWVADKINKYYYELKNNEL